ncbi:hypothetical protein KKD04_00290 [Patescibacteria group bacterium]|nr:hypothetical protein [Patescibacteria group bacterium]
MKYWVILIGSFRFNPCKKSPIIKIFYGDILDITGRFLLAKDISFCYQELPKCDILVLGDDGKEYPEVANDLQSILEKYRDRTA